MAASHQFGGQWTEDKLTRLQKYLRAYTVIFKSNPRAAYFQTTFVDAFAGTGYRNSNDTSKMMALPLQLDEDQFDDLDATAFRKGSAQIALEVEPSFDNFLFIEKRTEYARELTRLNQQYPGKTNAIRVICGDANDVLRDWCHRTNWKKNRAVVFLDPYGMQVEWSTIALMAETKAIDLWILFPLGQAVSRVLRKHSPPDGAWASRLTTFFGTPSWKDAFYKPSQQLSLFGEQGHLDREASFSQIGAFFTERLGTVFTRVADNPLPLNNSRNVPIYLLCFASANPKGASTAVEIAQHILRP